MRQRGWVFAVLFAALMASSPANASPIALGDLAFGLDQPYAGNAASPEGTSPWLVATFENQNPKSVRLTMNAGNLAAGSQEVSSWFFNFNEKLSLFSLEFVPQSTITFTGAPLAPDGISDGTSRLFDFKFIFAPNAFVPGAVSVYDILYTGPDNIDASSFEHPSFSSDPNTVNYYSAATVAGIGAGGTLVSQIAADRVLTPNHGPGPSPIAEPSTLLLLGNGLAGLVLFVRKKLAK